MKNLFLLLVCILSCSLFPEANEGFWRDEDKHQGWLDGSMLGINFLCNVTKSDEPPWPFAPRSYLGCSFYSAEKKRIITSSVELIFFPIAEVEFIANIVREKVVTYRSKKFSTIGIGLGWIGAIAAYPGDTNYSGVNIPVVYRITFTPNRVLGLGLEFYANLNMRKVSTGATFHLLLNPKTLTPSDM